MITCQICNEKFPTSKRIDGKRRNLRNRKYCLVCSPYRKHNTKKLHLYQPNGYKKPVQCKCKFCDKFYLYHKRGAGYGLDECSSCRVTKRRHTIKKQLVGLKGSKCEKCGYCKCITALSFHHLDPKTKEFDIAQNTACRKYEDLIKEINKCILLCMNCHNEEHYLAKFHRFDLVI